ncbi:hypothetical protein AC529_03630 [Thermobifida cellulosilytica TB100]|jgi:hypothetical protein|uniref:Uncharacterized protein n=1 Tax=Thermobifida cellulosilytica TB100 TaxID=665004 RepID=A0A147KLC4_THECS|nr:hypothetical protein AC529_03630 [Thermobifida cellulosilytica TB100]
MLLIRPDAAHRVTVLGSTRKREATSPGVSKRSVVLSTFTIPLRTRPDVVRAFDPLVCMSRAVSSLVFGKMRGNVGGDGQM